MPKLSEPSISSNVGRFAMVPLWLLDEVVKHPAPGTTLQVWCAMFEWANYTSHELHPSQPAIAKRAGVSVTSCRDALRRLQVIGAVRCEQRRSDEGDPDTNSYTLLLDSPSTRRGTPRTRQTPLVISGEGSLGISGEGSLEIPTTNESHLNETNMNESKSAVAETATPARHRDELFDAVVEACGLAYDEMTKTAKRACAVAVAELRDVGANPLNVRTRAVHYRSHFGDAALTPSALAKHWAQCRTPAAPAPQRRRRSTATDIEQELLAMNSRGELGS